MFKSSSIPKKLWQVPGLNQRVALFLIYSFVFHIGLLGITDVLLNFYLVSIGYDPEVIGILQALPRLSGFLTGLPVGLIANRLGNRRIIIISTIGISICVAATVLVEGLVLLGLSRFLWGVFFGAGQVVKPPYMMTLTDKNGHTAQFSYHNFVSMIAVAFGSAIGGFMPLIVSGMVSIPVIDSIRPEQMPIAYQGAIFIAAVIILLSAIPLYWLPKDKLLNNLLLAYHKPERKQSVPWWRLIKLAYPLLIFGISGGLTFPFFNLFFREQYGIADGAVGGVLALGWFFMGIIPLINPIWEAKMGRVMALTSLMVISAMAFGGLGMAQTLVIAILFYVLAIGLRNTMQPLYQPLFMDSIPSHLHNLASSIGLVLWNIGWFGATLSFGYLQVTIGYSNIMIVVAFFVLLNGLSIFVLYKFTQ